MAYQSQKHDCGICAAWKCAIMVIYELDFSKIIVNILTFCSSRFVHLG